MIISIFTITIIHVHYHYYCHAHSIVIMNVNVTDSKNIIYRTHSFHTSIILCLFRSMGIYLVCFASQFHVVFSVNTFWAQQIVVLNREDIGFMCNVAHTIYTMFLAC